MTLPIASRAKVIREYALTAQKTQQEVVEDIRKVSLSCKPADLANPSGIYHANILASYRREASGMQKIRGMSPTRLTR